MPAEETGQKRSDKPPPRQSQQAGEKRSTKRPPQEGVRLEAVEKSSRKESPILQETSTLAAEQISTKRLPQEIGVRLEAMEKSSRKGPPNERLKEAQELREAEERLRKPPALVLQAAHPFADEPPEETGQKRSAKAPPQHGVPTEETGQKRSDKPPPQQSQQAGEKRSTKRPPQEGVRIEAVEQSSRKKSSILQETSTLAAEQISTKRLPQEIGVRLEATEKSSHKGPPNERLKEAQELREAEERLRKPPALVLQAVQKSSSQVQETSKQSSWRRRFITEEDDKMFSCNVDLFSAELVDRFEVESPILQETSTQAGEQSSTKQPPQEEGVRLEATEKSSHKGPPNERLNEAQELGEAEERLRKPPVLVLQAAHPFADEPPEETGQKRSAKAPPQHGVPAEETGQKRSDKPPPRQSQQAGEKRSTKRPPQEGVRLEAVEKSSRKKSSILQETSTLAAEQISTKRLPQEIGVRLEAMEKSSRKGPPNERLKEAQELKEAEERLRKPLALVSQAAQKSSSQVQETSKQSSRRRRFITEEDDEMFSCNVDPFSAELVDRFEAESPILQETSTQAGEQSSMKRPPQEEGVRLEATEKSSHKGPLNERLNEAQELKEAEKRLRKPPALVLQAAQKSSSQVQETSNQSSRRRRFIMEEDDKMFSWNVDPFSAELVD